MNYISILEDLIKRDFETSWFEFKENWFNADKLGEYISALSNSAKVNGSDFAYFFLGISDEGHEIVGTNFDYNLEINHEPLEHYLLRNLYPHINFRFDEFKCNGKRIDDLYLNQKQLKIFFCKILKLFLNKISLKI